MTTIQVTEYVRPTGRKRQASITVEKEDAEYIANNNIKVSAERYHFKLILYFDWGKKIDDDPDEPDELIMIGNNTVDLTKSAIKRIKKLKSLKS